MRQKGSERVEDEKELELSVDKVYCLPAFQIVKYQRYYLAIVPEQAKWIVLGNKEQLEILDMLQKKAAIIDVLEKYKDFQDDVIDVLTQIEAKRLEDAQAKSIFLNTRLHLHVTNQCNMRCPHCYMESGAAYSDELSTDEIKELCRRFSHIGGTDVSLTGGEPTVRSDFFELVEYISGLGMKVSIFSNGLIWDEERVKRLAAQNIEGVQISIDGYDEASNSEIRGKGAFDRALNAVHLFVKHHIYVKIAVTAPYERICKHQAEYIAFAKGLLEKCGNDAIEFNFSYFFMPGRELSASRVEAIKREYYTLVDQVVAAIYGDVSEDSFVSNVMNCVRDSCGYGGLNVMANGDFYFCDRIPDVSKIGNIRNMPFEKVFRLMKIAENAGKIDNFKPCGACELKYICGGGCRAEHFKQFTQIKDVTDIDFVRIAPRVCDRAEKEKFYELMLKTNERFYC